MLNDYEIKRVEQKNKVHPITSILKLVTAFLAIYCAILLIPDGVAKVHENREHQSEQLKIRVVANSNTVTDQQVKNNVVDNLTPIISELGIVDNDEVYASLASYVTMHYPQQDVKVNIGEHLTPPKIENFTFYPQNMYNSLVLTIGSGRGDNFWCSMFKNVCERPEKIEKEEEKTEVTKETEVKFVIWEWFKGLFA